jgi:hypothetical protein
MAGKNFLGVSIAFGDREMGLWKKKLDHKARKDFMKQTDRVTQESSLMLLEAVRKNASGRPGPRVITNAYRSSWGAKIVSGKQGQQVAVVASDHPAAWRLEYGFSGRDSLGRNYNQPPFPHFRPAFEKTQEFFFKSMDAVMAEWTDK